MHVPCAAVSPGDNVNVGTVMFAGFKLRVVNAQNSHSNGKTVSLVASLYNQIA